MKSCCMAAALLRRRSGVAVCGDRLGGGGRRCAKHTANESLPPCLHARIKSKQGDDGGNFSSDNPDQQRPHPIAADARTAVFTSQRTLAELLRPQANEMIEYRIALTLPGTSAHASQRPGKSPGGRGTADEAAGRLVRVLRKPYVGAQLSEGRVF